MQDVTIASFIGIANSGNDGASGGGGCGGITGGASSDAKATGGFPLLVTTRTGYAGGDGCCYPAFFPETGPGCHIPGAGVIFGYLGIMGFE